MGWALIVRACVAGEVLSGPYTAEVLRVIDGDTIEARVRIWLGQDVTARIRVRGIDTPELRGRCPGEREAAAGARKHLTMLLAGVPVTLSRIGNDKFGGRLDASVALPDGSDIAHAMKLAGHAREWSGRRGACPG